MVLLSGFTCEKKCNTCDGPRQDRSVGSSIALHPEMGSGWTSQAFVDTFGVVVRTRGGPMGKRHRDGVSESSRLSSRHIVVILRRQSCAVSSTSRAAGSINGCVNPLSDRALEDQRLLSLIRAAYAASRGVYGAPRIFLDLREAGETCSTHRVARIMRANHLNALTASEPPGTRAAPRHSLRPIRCNEALSSNDRTQPGAPTSPTCARGRAGSSLPS